ncbi:hypothetical protein Nmel_002551, partial [Mimus melanotis]
MDHPNIFVISNYSAAETLQNKHVVNLIGNPATIISTTDFFASISCGSCVVA